MNKMFKKVISATMAMIMAVGVTAVGSVGVFAADEITSATTYDLSSSGSEVNPIISEISESSSGSYSAVWTFESSITSGAKDYSATYGDTTKKINANFDSNKGSEFKFYGGTTEYTYAKNASAKMVSGSYFAVTVSAGETVVIDVVGTNASQGHFSISKDDTTIEFGSDNKIAIPNKATQVVITFATGGTYKFIRNQKELDLCAVGIKPASNAYTLRATGTTSGDLNKFSFNPATVTSLDDDTKVTISYTSDDYTMDQVEVKASDFTVDESATTKTATYDVSSLTLTEKLYTAKVTTDSTYKGTFSLSKTEGIKSTDEITLSYEGTDYTMTEQTFSVNNTITGVTVADGVITVTPQSSWFKKILSTISVEPNVTGESTVFNFVVDEDCYLIDNNENNTGNSAYSEYAAGCYVLLTSKGAALKDDSTDAPAKLVVPYSANSGRVTVSGSVTPTNNIGSTWALVNISDLVYVASDGSKNAAITNNTSSKGSVNAGEVTKDQTITYSVTLDLDTKTASGTITNGTTKQTFSNIDLKAGKNTISSISFVTNNGNSITNNNDRALTIPSVTITKEAATDDTVITQATAVDKVAYIITGGKKYAVAVVSSTNAKEADSFYLKQGEEERTDDLKVVYKSITIGGKEYTVSELVEGVSDAYLYGFTISNTEDVASTIADTTVEYKTTAATE